LAFACLPRYGNGGSLIKPREIRSLNVHKKKASKVCSFGKPDNGRSSNR
jgi:hypothetical protein